MSDDGWLSYLWYFRACERHHPGQWTARLSFFLVFGAEAVLPTELEYDSPRTKAFNDIQATTDAQLNVDLLDEMRDIVII